MTPSQVKMQWGLQIPLRDGVHLSATLYMPGQLTGPAPCLVALTPYTVHRNHPRASYFARQGYPFLVVDARGRGNSAGTFRPLIQEAADGYDIVEWIARQRFCNGKVGMFSGSYEGYAQWATAKEHPPHLATIVPAMAAAPGIDFPMRKNMLSTYLVQWLTFVAGRTSQERVFEDQEFWRQGYREWYESGRPFRELDSILGNPSAVFQEWLTHPQQDAYWDAHRPTAAQYANLDLPILTLTGCYDGDQHGALHYYREHRRYAQPAAFAKHHLVIGPWDHAGTLAPKREFAAIQLGPQAMLDMLELQLQWYDWTLRGGPKPEFLRNNVAYYVMGADTWRYAASLEEITQGTSTLYLDSPGSANAVFASGTLQTSSGKGEPDTYTHDPRDLAIAAVEARQRDVLCLRPAFPTDNLTDQTVLHACEGRELIYHGDPIEADTQISGFFKLSLWIAIDQPDCDFRACIYTIEPDGGSLLLATDSVRARYRSSLREQELVQTTQPLHYDFDGFNFISRLLRKGSRLRVTLGPAESIYGQRNYNTGGVIADQSLADARTVRVSLFHDASHPSLLIIPLGPVECEQTIGQGHV